VVADSLPLQEVPSSAQQAYSDSISKSSKRYLKCESVPDPDQLSSVVGLQCHATGKAWYAILSGLDMRKMRISDVHVVCTCTV
jgi:hypothetical protein